jgi:hypothetical protein
MARWNGVEPVNGSQGEHREPPGAADASGIRPDLKGPPEPVTLCKECTKAGRFPVNLPPVGTKPDQTMSKTIP